MEDNVKQLIDQALALSYNYLCTGRQNKAIETLAQVSKIDPDNEALQIMMRAITSGNISVDISQYLEMYFGKQWLGHPLTNKSIEVFCDQGMGDTLNCLRYLKYLKDTYDCRIVLNCYAFYDQFKRFMELVDCVDEITSAHVICDYCTNILSIPNIINDLKGDIYPAHWQELLDTPILPQITINNIPKFKGCEDDGFKVGLAWHSNLENPIGQKKSIALQDFCVLEDGVNELWSLLPDGERCNMMVQPKINDLLDTASLIQEMKVVVSVDTVVLHLAGLMQKKTLGLLPFEADARWGLGDSTAWYPTVELFGQSEKMDHLMHSGYSNWDAPIRSIKERLESLRALM